MAREHKCVRRKIALIESNNVVHMEAIKRGGFWKVETVRRRRRAFLPSDPIKKNMEVAAANTSVAHKIGEKDGEGRGIDLAVRRRASNESRKLLRWLTRDDARGQKDRKRGGVLTAREKLALAIVNDRRRRTQDFGSRPK